MLLINSGYTDQYFTSEERDGGDSRRSSVSRCSEPVHQYSSTGFTQKGGRTGRRPGRRPGREGISPRSRSLPRNSRFASSRIAVENHAMITSPVASSTAEDEPLSEAIVEEERANPDGKI